MFNYFILLELVGFKSSTRKLNLLMFKQVGFAQRVTFFEFQSQVKQFKVVF